MNTKLFCLTTVLLGVLAGSLPSVAASNMVPCNSGKGWTMCFRNKEMCVSKRRRKKQRKIINRGGSYGRCAAAPPVPPPAPTPSPAPPPVPAPVPPSPTPTDVPPAICLEEPACNAQRRKMGLTRYARVSSSIKGCFMNDRGGAFWGTGGDAQQNGAMDLGGGKTRILCDLSERDGDWLRSHNTRRKEWHERDEHAYVPLKWSNALKADSAIFAETLLDSCGKGMYHDKTDWGENVAGNSGKGGWGELKTTEQVLSRFVEREADWEWPRNSHLTQVLWRATRYVGCAEAARPKEGGGMCRTQVCRYASPGNCGMGKHEDPSRKDWWKVPVMAEKNRCGHDCPPEGCY